MRWSGVLVQAHNLVRDVIGNFDEAALQNGLDPKTQAAEVEAAEVEVRSVEELAALVEVELEPAPVREEDAEAAAAA